MSNNNQALDPTRLMNAVRQNVAMPECAFPEDDEPESMTIEDIVARVAKSAPSPARNASFGRRRQLIAHAVAAQPRRRLPHREGYSAGEVYSFYDVEFVHAAYMATCRRAPDPEGERHFLQALRSGVLSKVDVLGSLRWSEEGRRNNVPIQGLWLPYQISRVGRRRGVGPVVRWLQALLGLSRIKYQLRMHDNARVAESMEMQRELADIAARLRLLDDSIMDAAVLEQRADHLERDHVSKDEFNRLQFSHDELKRSHSVITSRVAELEARLVSVADRLPQAGALDLGRESEVAAEAENVADDVYVAFEEAFRGSRESVLLKVESYNAWMRECAAGTCDAPILDVGCGRGEWLELVREHGWVGRGIDLNKKFVEHCRSLNLDVSQGDAIERLREMPDGSVGAITSMHLVEHLPYVVTIALIDECLRVLRPGGSMILETPNPENLLVGAHWFYLDPTHKNPIPPVSLAWLVKQRGFEEARVERLTHGREMDVPEPLVGDDASSQVTNFILKQFSYAPDYAIVGRKAAS